MRTETLTTCADSFEAHLLRDTLDLEGIECILSNENMNQIYAGVMGVGVLVLEKDLEKAQMILSEFRKKSDTK